MKKKFHFKNQPLDIKYPSYYKPLTATLWAIEVVISCKRNLIPSRYLSLLDNNLWRSSLAIPSKPLLFSCTTFFHQLLTTPDPKMFLPVITPFFMEGRCFSQSLHNSRHIIENDPQYLVYIVVSGATISSLPTTKLCVWPNHSITTQHKAESLKYSAVHSHQAKLTSPHSVSNQSR